MAAGVVGAQREQAAYDPSVDARETLDQLSTFLEHAELVGTETVEGRPAYHLKATGIDQVQKVDQQEYRMESISLFVDREAYVAKATGLAEVRLVSSGDDAFLVIEILSP